MFKKMLTRGTVLVAGLIASQAVIEKLEKSSLKRKEKSRQVTMELKKQGEITEEELKEAFEMAHKMADELEAEHVK